MRKLLLGAAIGVLGLGAIALAQTTPLRNFLGTELMKLTLGSGSVIDVTLSQVRNTRGMSLVGARTAENTSPTGNVAMLCAVGAITTWSVTLPNPADKGQIFQLCNATTAAQASVRVTASTGTQTQTMNTTFNSIAVGASSPVGWVYDTDTSTWYRFQ